MSNSIEQQKLRTKKIGPVLFLSGLFVAMSYIVLFIPFALYSVAQISAMLGKRYGLLIMVFVFVALFVLFVILNSSLIFISAVLLFVSIPFFMIAVALREKVYPKIASIIVLLIPVFISFYSITFLDKVQFNEALSGLEQNMLIKKQEIQKQVETNVSASGEKNLIAKYDEALSQVQSLRNFKELNEFLSYNAWQRMTWLVFGVGSMVFFFALLISFANIIFLDLAFEQVEKIKAIIAYVLKNMKSFSYEFVLALSQMPVVEKLDKGGATSSFAIVKHEANPLSALQNQGPNVKVIRLSIFKAPNSSNRIFLRGYSFLYEGKLKTWNLKQFSLPLPLVFFAIVFMAAIMFWFGGPSELMVALATNRYAPLIGTGCVLSYVLLSILTLQGLFTFYIRVSNLVGLLFVFCLFVLGSSFSIGYYAILAVFGSIALLDYVYDWRKKKIR